MPLDDLKRRKEIEDDAFYGLSMDWPHAVGIIAALFLIAWALDRIERRAEIAATAPVAVEQPVLSHPLRGPDCDITITQRDDKGQWGPERCAKGVRK